MGGGCHMAKSMVTMCHMGRIILVSHMTLVMGRHCEDDTWKPRVTKIGKWRINSVKGKSKEGRKEREGKERKGRGGEMEEDRLFSLHFPVFDGPRSRHCSRSKR